MTYRSHRSITHRRPQGSATLVVLMFLLLMMAFVWSNSAALSHLKSDLRLLEQRQLRKYQAAGSTNAPALPAKAPAVQVAPP